MKLRITQTVALFSMVLIFLSSCGKDGLQEPPIVDPPTFSHIEVWEEAEMKSGSGNWEIIPDGNRLTVWWEFMEDLGTSIQNTGAYRYDPANLGISVDTAGNVQIKNNLLSFIFYKKDSISQAIYRDTTNVQYFIVGDTSLVIRNASTQPAVEIKFRKVK
ncbi:hypothetical protein [Longitalea arenae]|uniref:hypothetical protein n=1 Tax=Longitalea arenae TaxID=2812558 RepID=UPI0019686294|nr:hypothetical protein [Longitalea arenae]